MKIINITQNTIIADNAVMATSLRSRTVGLLNRENLNQNEALILKPCNSIHTFFMRFAIDVIFVNNKGRVVKVISNLKPFRITAIYLASYTIELPIGVIERSATQAGDIIAIE